LEVRAIASSDQVADIFTKLVTKQMLDRMEVNVNLVAIG
jgi:hypothetical protein